MNVRKIHFFYSITAWFLLCIIVLLGIYSVVQSFHPRLLVEKDPMLIQKNATNKRSVLGGEYSDTILPPDIFLEQITVVKRLGSISKNAPIIAIVGPTFSALKTETFIGVLQLNRETNTWEKFIKINNNSQQFHINDIAAQLTGTPNQIFHLFLSTNDGGGSGDSTLLELVQNSQHEKEWNVFNCSSIVGAFGTVEIYSKDKNGIWYTEEYNMQLDRYERINANTCNNPPSITLY